MNTILKVNSRGTMTLPKAVRNLLGVSDGGTLVYSLNEDGVVLQPAVTYPIEIYTDERIAEFDAEDAALAGAVEELYKKKGLVYPPEMWTIREKKTAYRGKKKKA